MSIFRQVPVPFDTLTVCFHSDQLGTCLQGADAIPFLERLVVGDIQALKDGTGSLSLITNERGGIIDDTVITKVSSSEIYMVFNAGCRDKDLEHFNKQLDSFPGDCKMVVHNDRCLLAFQGPRAVEILQPLVKADLSKVYFSHFVQGLKIAGVDDCFLTRTGCAASENCVACKHTHLVVATSVLSLAPLASLSPGTHEHWPSCPSVYTCS